MTTAMQSPVRGRWFPADVVLPGQSRPWNRCYVLVTDVALCVFRQVSETPTWQSPIVWSSTVLPATDRDASRGFDVQTAMGLAVVTLGSGCRCGSLGRWKGPLWAREVGSTA